MNPLAQLIEAALFSAPRPLTVEELNELDPDVSLAEVQAALDQLREHYDFDGMGSKWSSWAAGSRS